MNTQFFIVFLNKRIKKCYGCAKKFSRKYDGSVLNPPHDIVMLHEGHCEYYHNGKKCTSPRPQNTYYHPSVSCIKSKCSFFKSEFLSLAKVHDKLLPEHLMYIHGHFRTL